MCFVLFLYTSVQQAIGIVCVAVVWIHLLLLCVTSCGCDGITVCVPGVLSVIVVEWFTVMWMYYLYGYYMKPSRLLCLVEFAVNAY